MERRLKEATNHEYRLIIYDGNERALTLAPYISIREMGRMVHKAPLGLLSIFTSFITLEFVGSVGKAYI